MHCSVDTTGENIDACANETRLAGVAEGVIAAKLAESRFEVDVVG